MIAPDRVSAIVVTRGDVALDRVLAPLAILGETIVYDNSQRTDLAVYGRYAAIDEAKGDAILVVDDDVELSAEAVTGLHAAYKPGVLTANMPPEHQRRYPDSALVGFGAIFDRDLPDKAFKRFMDGQPPMFTEGQRSDWTRRYPGEWTKQEAQSVIEGERFCRTCDIVFSVLTPRKIIDVPFTHLPHTWAENRMYRQKGNSQERRDVLRLARMVRGAHES